MSSVLTLACKDLLLLSRDRMGLFFIVVFPVIMGVGFGLIFSSSDTILSADNALPVAVLDLDDSLTSRHFVGLLRDTAAIDLRDIAGSREELVRLTRKGELAAFVTLPPGFGESAGLFWREAPTIGLGIDPSRRAEGALIRGMVMESMGRLVQYRIQDTTALRQQLRQIQAALNADDDKTDAGSFALRGFLQAAIPFVDSLDELYGQDEAEGDGTADANDAGFSLVKIDSIDVLRKSSKRKRLLNKIQSKWDVSFPAAMLWGVCACVAGFAVSMVKERNEGTLFRLQVAPMPRWKILAGKALAGLVGVCAVIAFMVALGLLLGMQIVRPGSLVVAAGCTAVAFVGLMMLMSLAGKTEQGVGGAAWAMIIVMCMFGGGMMPLAFLPGFMRTVSHFSPVKWAILALEGAIWRDLSPAEMLLPCGVLLSVGLVSFLAGIAVLSRREC